MANRYTVANGLASAVATWDGGATVPVEGDNVVITHTATGASTFSTNTAGYAIGATAITLTGTVLAGSFVVGQSVQFAGDPNYYAVTNWNSGTKVLTVAPLIVAIPAAATVVTSRGHVVTIDGTYTWGDDTAATSVSTTAATGGAIRVNGTIKASRSVTSSLTAKGDMVISATGTLDYGTAGDPIPSTYTATLLLNKAASAASVKYGLITIQGAQTYSYGTPRVVNTTLTSTANAAAVSIAVADATGWAVGDRIFLHSTTATAGNTDERTITSITPGTGTAATIGVAALTYQHLSGCSVGNFTHNVVFKSFAAATPGYFVQQANTAQLGNTRISRYTLIENLGDAGNATTYKWCGWGINTSGSTFTADPFSLRDCSFYTLGNALSAGFVVFSLRYRSTFSDLAIACNNSRTAIYEGSGAVADFYRVVVYRAGDSTLASNYSQGGVNCRHYFCKLYGSGIRGLNLGAAVAPEFYDCDIGANVNIAIGGSAISAAKFVRCTIGSVFPNGGTTAIVESYADGTYVDVLFEDCQFQSGVPIGLASGTNRIQVAASSSKLVVSNKNADPLQQEIWTPGGIITRDNTFARDASGSSLKMSPHSTANSFSFDLYVYAPYNKPVVVSGYVYVNTAYGTTYPVTVALSGLGITTSTWTENTGTRDAWQQFLVGGTNLTGSDGMLKLTVTVRGSAGNVWVDGVSAPTPVAVNSGEFGYWSQGLPAGIISANYVAATDVWNTLTSDLTLDGSIGKALATSPLPVNVTQVKGQTITGSGVYGDPWVPA